MANGSDEDAIAARRSAAGIILWEADRLADESVAFDVIVNLTYAGHWVETKSGRAAVTWVDGELIETESCGGNAEKIEAAIRPLIPPSHLRRPPSSPGPSTPPKYDVARVEAVILEGASDLESEHFSTRTLLLKVVSDPDDAREIETGARAIRRLREVGLLTSRTDELVEPTPAALRAVELLT